MVDNPIGIFDSGIGGLTVLRAISFLLPEERTVYLGDTARVPYGSKSRETVIRYSLEDAEFLVGKGVKLIVVACNTASAFALKELKDKLGVPVIGVIEPGARAAVKATANKKIGVIGTEGTVRSGAYSRAIAEADPSVTVYQGACPLFVPLAEEGFTQDDVTTLVAERYLAGLKAEGIDTLVLGCTHYPILKDAISSFMGDGVRLIDSADATAQEVKRALASNGLLRASKFTSDEERHAFFVTDSPERFVAVGKRFFGSGLKVAQVARVEHG